ncbi:MULTISPECIES: site-specific DNA-methyltransferase [unclassified Roseitalea]|uniref:site-specific DNA-methyltransferase n=1 Tax=unclassified Roseitalea TaxID=2639107 RepID=UPI00273F6AFF|nr:MULTISPECIES: site-specific DNA-methyltransferase [unclassified Roseitalea]
MDALKKEDGESLNIIDENIEALKAIFPDAFTEDGVDFEALRQLLGDQIAEGDEKFGLTWFGKKKARQIALTPSTGTLRPARDESVDWSATQNLFIEGDNLEVLKLLQRGYAGKVSMIYIDPPYNTGREFIYPDKFQDNLETYLRYTCQIDNEGMKFSSNTEAGGRKHSNWLTMMYPRLKLAKTFLKNDGVIFVSIDDNEISNLRAIMDDIFGEENFISQIIWKKTENIKMDSRFLSQNKDYVLCYRASADLTEFAKEQSDISRFNLEDDRGKYYLRKLDSKSSAYRKTLDYVIEHEGVSYYAGGSFEDWQGRQRGEVGGFAPRWLWSEEKYKQGLAEGDIVFKNGNVYNKVRYDGVAKKPHVDMQTLVSGQTAQKELDQLFGKRMFDHPKPPQLIEWLLSLLPDNEDATVLDFFAGSSTSAHAVMQANAKDGGTRRFIMIQLPEAIDEGHDASRAGMRDIAQLSRKRIVLAAEKLREDYAEEIAKREFPFDTGFKSFKLDQSNIRAWNPDASDLEQSLLDHAEHLVEGRSEQDVLYELLLKRGVDLTVPIEEKEIAGKAVYSIGFGVLFACLDDDIKKDEIEPLAQGIVAWHKELEPASDTQVVFRDSAFADDIAKTNMTAILEQNGIAHVRSL